MGEPVGLPKLLQKLAAMKMPGGGGATRGVDGSDGNVFLLDAGSKIFVWTGKNANSSDKVASLGAADRYAMIEPRANDVPVTIVKAGQERCGLMSFLKQ